MPSARRWRRPLGPRATVPLETLPVSLRVTSAENTLPLPKTRDSRDSGEGVLRGAMAGVGFGAPRPAR